MEEIHEMASQIFPDDSQASGRLPGLQVSFPNVNGQKLLCDGIERDTEVDE
jgi:hypothetical protein